MSVSFFPTQLIEIWEANGKRAQFDMVRKDWPENYLDHVALIGKIAPTILESWWNPDSKNADGNFTLITVRFTPLGLKMIRELTQEHKDKPGPKTNRTQITIDGQKVDLRNRDNWILVTADIKEVENVAASYLHQLRNEPTKRVRRACLVQLQRLMLLRGKEINRDLYGSICLRLGYPLPSDFWKLTGKLPEPTHTPLTASQQAQYDSISTGDRKV